MIWFTSDNHFYHKNIIRFCNRPFETIDDMNETMIRNWNKVVAPSDIIYVLGDFAFCGIKQIEHILARLNGYKVLIRGNHDKPSDGKMIGAGFNNVKEEETLYWAGHKFTLSHYPFAPTKAQNIWMHLKAFFKRKMHKGARYLERRPLPHPDGRWLFHGHVHCAWKVRGRMLNVGVDVHNFTPISLPEITAIIRESEAKKDFYAHLSILLQNLRKRVFKL